MPYISPKGALAKGIPPRKTAPTLSTQTQETAAQPKFSSTPQYFLEAESTRPRDPSVVAELRSWKGWGGKTESEPEQEDVDPLDETVPVATASAVKNDAEKRPATVEVAELMGFEDEL